jgi:hypothetical protein
LLARDRSSSKEVQFGTDKRLQFRFQGARHVHRSPSGPLLWYVSPNPSCSLPPADTHPDAEKDKYFKIEADRLATPSVKYTASSVKRIVEERQDARRDRRMKRIRREATMRRALPPGDLAAGVLRREMGECVGGRESEVDLVAETWVAGLEHKGTVRMAPWLPDDFSSVAYDERSDSTLFVTKRCWNGQTRACIVPGRDPGLLGLTPPGRPAWNLARMLPSSSL